MLLKSLYIISIFCLVNCEKEQLKITLYYEGLCPACHEFILTQLYSGYHLLGDSLMLDLVPLGHSWHKINNNKIEWTCQHGPLECYINKINACAINLNSTQSQLMEFINCVIKNSFYYNTPDKEEQISSQCATDSNLSWDDINNCLATELADNLELGYESRQNKLVPKLQYVPHILFNDKFDEEIETEAREDLIKTACKLYKVKPKGCKHKTPRVNNETIKYDKCYLNDVVDTINVMML